MSKVVGVVGCAAGGVEQLRAHLVEPLVARGHRVAVTLTPSAATWLREVGEVDRLAELTGLPVRSEPRMPSEARPHPKIDVFVLAPATANTVAKLAMGIADNQALSTLCEGLGTTPMVVFPRINAAHARHPSWDGHVEKLRKVGVRLAYGEDVWPLYEPREAPSDRPLPWSQIVAIVDRVLA
ncbi:MAG: flavoprotein [Propionibacteriales bacterium]|nr:flavoprotein [Propionibacteriales bacterium]